MNNTAAVYARGAGAYARVGVESGVMSANPHQLIVMLFDGVQLAIRKARLHISKGNVGGRCNAIADALEIVNQGLLAALDREQGGELAEQLTMLYEYVSNLLVSANLHADDQKLDEAARLLEDIGSAWREIGQPREEGLS